MEKRIILNSRHFEITLKRLASQLKENHHLFENTVLIGLQPRGIHVLSRLKKILEDDLKKELTCGQLDITFYRDDIRKEIMAPDTMHMPFDIENKTVVLIDDVLFTGRTIKAALDTLLDYGRPDKVELCVLIDRKEHRQFPIQADYAARQVETAKTDKVKLINGEVVLIPGA